MCRILCIYEEISSFSTMFIDKMGIIIIFFKLERFNNNMDSLTALELVTSLCYRSVLMTSQRQFMMVC